MSLFIVIAVSAAAAPARRPIGEDQAIDLVAKAMRQAYPDEPLRCFSFMTEDRTPKAFGIAARENHKRGCGGDPGVMPVRSRFRVDRSPIGLWRLDPVEGTYLRCQIVSGKPACPQGD